MDSRRQRRPLRTADGPTDVEAGPPSPSAAPPPSRPRPLSLWLARALLLLAAVYALALVLFASRGWDRRPARAAKRGQLVRFRDGDAVYADDFDAAVDGVVPPDALDFFDADGQERAEDGPVDVQQAVQGPEGAPRSPREILARLNKVGPRPGQSAADPSSPRPTAAPEAVLAAVEHARSVRMLPPAGPDDRARRFRCVGWRATTGCSPFGPRDPAGDAPCASVVPPGRAGYCEVQDKDSGELFRVMHVHCASLVPAARFRCVDAWDFATFPVQARDAARAMLADTSGRGLLVPPSAGPDARGVVLVAYPKLVPSAYATVRTLRDLGCSLPVELWFREDELARAPGARRALRRLQAEYGPVELRAIDARLKRAVGFAAKIHAISHSSFGQLLFLDADNAPVQDPSFLFASREFRDTGALFWPDFWHPGHTIFNVRPTSLVWELLGVRSVRMFEQESGQLLVDRARHAEPLALVNFYTFHRPSHLERLRLVWGDKDLFRLAWLKARAPFHMVRTPPAVAGLLVNGSDFCGMTMAQHDPQGRVLFLHRNARKLLGVGDQRPKRTDERTNKRHGTDADAGEDGDDAGEDEEDLPEAPDGLPDPVIWTHLLSFRGNESRTSDYVVDIYNLPPVVPDWQSCYGVQKPLESPHFALQAVRDLPFAGLELKLRTYAREAAALAEADAPE